VVPPVACTLSLTATPTLAPTLTVSPRRRSALARPPDPVGRGKPVRSGEHEGELVSAHPGHQIARAYSGGEACDDGDQHFVARGVTQPVDDRLEPVEVDQQHRRVCGVLGEQGGAERVKAARLCRPVSGSWCAW
jgi:hypothetical protein